MDGLELKTDNDPSHLPPYGCEWKAMDLITSYTLMCPEDFKESVENDFLIDYIKVYKPIDNPEWLCKQDNSITLNNSAYELSPFANIRGGASEIKVNNGPNNIYYIGTNNRIWNYWWNGSSYNNSCLNLNPGAAALNSPDLEIDPMFNRLYYGNKSLVGGFDALMYLDLNNGFNEYFTGVFNFKSNIVARNNGGVFYLGTDNNIWNYWWNPWANVHQIGMVTTKGNAISNLILGPNGELYYTSTDNNIWTTFWTPFGWSTPTQVTTIGNVDIADNNVVYDNLYNKFYYKSIYNTIWNTYNTGSGLGYSPLQNWNDYQNVAGAVALSPDHNKIYYIDNLHRVSYYFHDFGWSNGGNGAWYQTPVDTNYSVWQFQMPNSPPPAFDWTFNSNNIEVRNDGTVFYGNIMNKLISFNFNRGDIMNPSCNGQSGISNRTINHNLNNNQNSLDQLNNVEINEKKNSDNNIELYPNPNTGEFTLSIANFNNNLIKYQVIDVTGKILQQEIFETTPNSLFKKSIKIKKDVPSGSYFLNVICNNKSSKKIIFIEK